MSSCTDESGQASVEAAIMLPVFLVVLGLFCQPAILLYDKAVMKSAAAEGCRLVATSTSRGIAVEGYLHRRLAAIPEVDAFHVGEGGGWNVSWEGPGESGEATVRISGRARPLPLFGVLAGLSGHIGEGGLVELQVEEKAPACPVWAQDAGTPQDWIGAWQ